MYTIPLNASTKCSQLEAYIASPVRHDPRHDRTILSHNSNPQSHIHVSMATSTDLSTAAGAAGSANDKVTTDFSSSRTAFLSVLSKVCFNIGVWSIA